MSTDPHQSTPSVPAGPRSHRTALAAIFATVCVDLLGFGLLMPLLPLYGKDLLQGRSNVEQGAWLGLLMVSFSLMQFLFAPLWGRLSDRIGRRPVLLASLCGSAVFYAVFGFASLARSLGGMLAARIGAGIASATIPTAQAYIADVTPPEKRAKGMALIGAAFGLGFTLGPMLAALALVVTWNEASGGFSPWPGFLASGLSLAALAFAAFRLPESYDPSRITESHKHFDWASLRAALAIPSIGLLLATGFLAVFSLANFEGTISLAIDAKLQESRATDAAEPVADRPVSDLHSRETLDKLLKLLFLFTYIGVVQSLIQGVLVRRLANFVSDAWLAVCGAMLSIAGFALLALAMHVERAGAGFFMAAATVVISGIAFVFPAIPSLLSRRSDPGEQGGVLGAAESISSIARISGVYLGVNLFKQIPALPYWLAAGLMALALILVSAAARSGRDWGSPSSRTSRSPS